MKKMKTLNVIVCMLLVLGLSTSVMADNYPSKPIKVIIPYAAGGGNDVLMRAFQKPLEKELGAKILIENIPAGNTKMGTLELLKARPDGYTIMLISDIAWVGYYYAGTYDSKTWYKVTPIANLTTEPLFFFETRAENPYNTWKELMAYAKKNPDKIFSCGAPGTGGTLELVTMDIMKKSGIPCKFVPFQGAGPSKIALLGGHVDFRVCQITEAITMIRAGKTKGLAISSEKRFKAAPNVPTFKELGFGTSWTLPRAFWGPPKLPESIVNTLTKAIEKASKDPAFVKMAEEQFLYDVEYRTPKQTYEALDNYDKDNGARLTAAYKK